MALNLGKDLYLELSYHLEHEIEIVTYGDGENIAIECVTCGEVLIDADKPA